MSRLPARSQVRSRGSLVARVLGLGPGSGGGGQPLAIAGAALAVVGLSYYLWRQVDARTGGESGWFGGGIKGHDGADAEAGQGPDKAGQSSSAKRLPPRPSLSLSLPPSFSRTPASLDLLRQLIETLSPAFLIHLITPPPPEDASQGDSGGDEYGVQSVAELAAALQDIALFDSRRVLEYSRSEGRQALARALACDAHLEVFLGSLPDDAEGPGMSAVQQEGEESEKPDKNEYEGPAAQYRGDIERLRRACGLVILLALPPLPGASALRSTAERAAQAQVNEVLSHYRANPPGVRLVDSRAQHSDVRAAWTDAAAQVREFRQGWR